MSPVFHPHPETDAPGGLAGRRGWLKLLAAAAVWPLAACELRPAPSAGPSASQPTAPAPTSARVAGSAALPPIEVWKTPTCGCCKLWVEHLQANGWVVVAHDVPDTSAYRQKAGIPSQFGSCHTAMVAGYALEGHVPAADIQRLLTERPAAVGLAVPGMPIGSPGMEQGTQKDPFDVLLVQKDGTTRIFSAYRG